LPAAQSEHKASPAAANLPAAHCPLHELLIEPPVPNRPAGQSSHAAKPAVAANAPAPQAVHADPSDVPE
jgi:hypothetical protein